MDARKISRRKLTQAYQNPIRIELFFVDLLMLIRNSQFITDFET